MLCVRHYDVIITTMWVLIGVLACPYNVAWTAKCMDTLQDEPMKHSQ